MHTVGDEPMDDIFVRGCMATQSNQPYSRSAAPSLDWLAYVRTYWAYRPQGKRDLRLDLLRGFCICVMVIDHIGGLSPLRAITGGNNFFVSAAEGFVFISGLLLGEVYRKLIVRDGFRAVLVKALQRAWKLYVLTFVLTIGLAYGAWLAGLSWVGPDDLYAPFDFALRVLTLRRSYLFTDILVMYTLLIVGAPLALWLLDRGWTWALLIGSWTLWLAYQIAPYEASQPLPTIQAFHPAAWQIFFVHAMTLGYHRQRIARWFWSLPHGRLLAGLGALFGLLLAVYLTRGALLTPLISGDIQAFLQAVFLKNPVRIGRIVAAAVVFPLAYLVVSYCWRPIQAALGWLLLPLGQHSLYSYTMHLPLLILFACLFGWPAGATLPEQLVNMAIQLAALLCIWLMIRRRFLFKVVPH